MMKDGHDKFDHLKPFRKALYKSNHQQMEALEQHGKCYQNQENAHTPHKRRKYAEASSSTAKAAAYIDDDEDEDDDINSFESCPYTPLKTEELLEVIASYLPSQEIRNCRLVCRKWEAEMSRCLEKRGSLLVTEKDCPTAKEYLRNFWQKKVPCPSKLYMFDVKPTSRLHKRLIASFGATLSALNLEECQVSGKELAEILMIKAPRLESFTFKDVAESSSQQESTFSFIQNYVKAKYHKDFCMPELKKLHWQEKLGKVRLEQIISICPNLIELIYHGTAIPHPPDFRRLRWNSLTSLKFYSKFELMEHHFTSLTSLKLKLRRLTLSGIIPLGKDRIRSLKKFLASLSPTLEELELFEHPAVNMVPYNPEYLSPFPVKLKKLTGLTVDFPLLRTLKAMNNLPELKWFSCASESSMDWSKVLKRGTPKTHKILSDISVGCTDSGTLLKMSKCFCYVTELRLSVTDGLDDKALRVICKGFSQLQKLRFTKVTDRFQLRITDSGLTGLPLEKCRTISLQDNTNYCQFFPYKEHPSIQDLKHLEILDLSYNRGSSITDISVLLGIANCTKLRMLTLPKCNITNMSLVAIEKRMKNVDTLDLPMALNVTPEGVELLRKNRKEMQIDRSDG